MKFNYFSMIFKQIWISMILQELWEIWITFFTLSNEGWFRLIVHFHQKHDIILDTHSFICTLQWLQVQTKAFHRETPELKSSHAFELRKVDTRVSYIDSLVQDCSISIANALEILQSCTRPSIYWYSGGGSLHSGSSSNVILWYHIFTNGNNIHRCSTIILDGFMQERGNSSANTLELRLSCTNPLLMITSRSYPSKQLKGSVPKSLNKFVSKFCKNNHPVNSMREIMSSHKFVAIKHIVFRLVRKNWILREKLLHEAD